MTVPGALIFFLGTSVIAAILACTSVTTERLLSGMIICSLGLGLAVQVVDRGYFGLLLMSAFIVTDLIVYLYLRTQDLIPSGKLKNARLDRAYRIFFVWLFGLAIAGMGAGILQGWITIPSTGGLDGMSGMKALHEQIWGSRWILLLIPFLSLVTLVIGGFFLVRREK